MELHSKNIRKILFIILFSIIAYTLVQNLGIAAQAFSWVSAVLSPFIIGLCLAFILNVPLKFLEERVLARIDGKELRGWKRWKRGICLTLTYLMVLLLILGL